MEIRYVQGICQVNGPIITQRRAAVVETIRLWLKEPDHRRLRRHDPKGRWIGHFSLSASGDIRIHLRWLEEGRRVRVVDVGSHSQLYR